MLGWQLLSYTQWCMSHVHAQCHVRTRAWADVSVSCVHADTHRAGHQMLP